MLIEFEYERRRLRKNRIILLQGEIESGTARGFNEDIHMLLTEESEEPVNIIISSPGGDVFAGLSIIRAIRLAQSHGIKVIGKVSGHACSMAFFILQCCDERIMGKLDILMAHGLTTGFMGDMKNLDAETKLLTYWHHELASLIASRCVGECAEPGWWFEILYDNTPQWYTAEESLEMGIIDKVDGYSKNKKAS
jgi:ATP-dependent Clp protease protease subunit